ncbi:RNA-directed DNA polymerase from mobile element jockey [Elysia marginata]|uniref:RNA-directed DNA polymerase from mobile element jockey n=1 Tax=Elysia marginata TaxID=1093978 RepID=A0AAV4JB62_9GAST|nr:RNA-directed DNA polymerase from mobile element jockey [Elysia marginata]
MLEVERKSDEEKLIGTKELGGLKVKVTKDSYLNTSRGVINHRDLRGSREEEFVEWIPGVISARMIEIKRGEERIKTNTYVLTFDSPTPPSEVKAGYLPVKVRPYVPTPMRCFRCHRFGHGRDRCRAREELCVKCGEPGHRGEECKRNPRCVNCKGEHPANSRSCPKYMKEQAILRYRAQNGWTFGQARATVILEVAKEVRPKLYAQAVRGGPIRKVTAPVPTTNKSEILPLALNSATRKTDRSNNKHKTEETRKPQTCGRYGADPEVDLESIDSIWSLPKNPCRVDRRAGGRSPSRPDPSRQSSPSQQSLPPQQGPPSQHLEACRAASEVLIVNTMSFNILQWNIRGLRANLEDFLNITKNSNIGIMAIQDSKLPEG